MTAEATPASRIGPAPDREAILRVMRLYADGFGAHRPEMFDEVFHRSARIYYTDAAGEFQQGLILQPDSDPDDTESWSNQEGQVEVRILTVIQAGDLACVVLGFDGIDDPANSWVDVHSLLRIDGVWKVMAKTATHASRGDWAGLRD